MLLENARVACNGCILCVCCLDEYFCAKAEELLPSGAAAVLVRELRAAALRRTLRAAREDIVVVEERELEARLLRLFNGSAAPDIGALDDGQPSAAVFVENNLSQATPQCQPQSRKADVDRRVVSRGLQAREATTGEIGGHGTCIGVRVVEACRTVKRR